MSPSKHQKAPGRRYNYCTVCGKTWPCEYAGMSTINAQASKKQKVADGPSEHGGEP